MTARVASRLIPLVCVFAVSSLLLGQRQIASSKSAASASAHPPERPDATVAAEGSRP